MKRLICLATLVLSLIACEGVSKLLPSPNLPYTAWNIRFAAPKHMEVGVETVDVLDQRGLALSRPWGHCEPYGQGQELASGSIRGQTHRNVDLSDQIFLRWQSLGEPQAYRIKIHAPQWVRGEMVKRQRVLYEWNHQWKDEVNGSNPLTCTRQIPSQKKPRRLMETCAVSRPLDQCTNSAIKIMIGIGMPRNQRSNERMMTLLNQRMLEVLE
jgi:hypothetical protein